MTDSLDRWSCVSISYVSFTINALPFLLKVQETKKRAAMLQSLKTANCVLENKSRTIITLWVLLASTGCAK